MPMRSCVAAPVRVRVTARVSGDGGWCAPPYCPRTADMPLSAGEVSFMKGGGGGGKGGRGAVGREGEYGRMGRHKPLCVCVHVCAHARARAWQPTLLLHLCTCVQILERHHTGRSTPPLWTGSGGPRSWWDRQLLCRGRGRGGRAGGRAGRRAGGRAGGGPRRLPGRHRVWRFAGGVSCLPWHSAQDLWQAVQCDSLGVLLQRGIEGRRAGGDGRVGDHVSEHEFMFRACSWHQKHALCLRT